MGRKERHARGKLIDPSRAQLLSLVTAPRCEDEDLLSQLRESAAELMDVNRVTARAINGSIGFGENVRDPGDDEISLERSAKNQYNAFSRQWLTTNPDLHEEYGPHALIVAPPRRTGLPVITSCRA